MDMSEVLGASNITTAYLLWVLLFSSIGFGFFIYGKKQKHYPALIAGIVLMIYPMFISNTYVIVLLGIILVLIPYFIE